MASNLSAARTLIQADLDHARDVLDLWTHQVGELERTLEQIDAVGSSRNALHVEYQGMGTRAPALEALAAPNNKPKRGRRPNVTAGAASSKPISSTTYVTGQRSRKLSERSTAAAGEVSEARPNRLRKTAPAKKSAAPRAAKYKDPNSQKTWSGRGRRPSWFSGSPDQYAIPLQGQNASTEGKGANGSMEE